MPLNQSKQKPPRMTERRQGDLLILEKLGAIQTDLALNTQETTRIAKAQETTNGKVAAHEVRQQSLEANQAVMATTLAQLTAANNSKLDEFKGWRDWAIKGAIAVIVMLFYYLLTHAGFPNFLSH
jgi:hypothetical protein